MNVYQASDGGLLQLDRFLSEYESLDQLIEDVANSSGLQKEHVLIFLQDGKELRKEVLEATWDRGGQGAGQSEPPSQTLYLFNRETFWTDAEKWAVELQEDVQFPPTINLSAINDVEQARHPFLVAFDHLSHLQSLFQAQARALEIAYANLFQHLQPLIRDFQKFALKAEGQLDDEAKLIRSAVADMTMLPKVIVHGAFLKKKERQDSGTSSQEVEVKVKTLADYVHVKKMEQVRDTCRVAHEDHVTRYNDLARQMDEIAAQSEAERKASETKASAVAKEFEESLERLDAAIGSVEDLLSSGAEGSVRDLIELDQAMRDDLVTLTGVKNEFTLDLHIHLRQVAGFQSRITEIVHPLTALDKDLRHKEAFPHLERLHQLPFAYAATVVEVVRRKEFSAFMLDWSTRLVEAIDTYTAVEAKRRHALKADTLSHLPWTIAALEDTMDLQVQIALTGSSDVLTGMNLGRPDIDDLMEWISRLKADPEILQAVGDGDDNPVVMLESGVQSNVANMAINEGDLDELVERLVLGRTASQRRSPRESQAVDTMSSQLSIAEREKADTQKALLTREEDHQQRVRQLQQQHDQRVSILQTRQGELQEELARLRTDLGEEMIARQALSAELEERSREQEDKQRDHDDYTDLVTALQVEMAQEKDRATDLGVRLQEALLDVDGLRNAEQSLITQVQSLQDDRSKSMQSLGEAQSQAHGLESQLAGLRAEMAATSQQLAKTRLERDSALKNQSAEAERMMRDHIAEADGDRAVLEHQNLTLVKQLEDAKVEYEQKLSATSNAAVREANGLKAELSFTKAQLRDVQRRETILADELAMAKDTATAITHDRSHQTDVARDAVALASKYHETCQRLLAAINASSTISGTASTIGIRPDTQMTASLTVSTKDDMRESVLIRSLAHAQSFDLVMFNEAVQKAINLVKKWSKSCKQYRDLARNKISFANFTKGDLALFLPTRNAAARSWAAFNVSAPHNFLRVTEAMQPQVSSREWLIARISKTDEAVASGGESTETNPFGLADGLRYYIHHVEDYNPAVVRPSRRSTSASYREPSLDTVSHDVALAERSQTAEAKTPFTPAKLRSDSGYFPRMSEVKVQDTPSKGSEIGASAVMRSPSGDGVGESALRTTPARVDTAIKSPDQTSPISSPVPITVPESPLSRLNSNLTPSQSSPIPLSSINPIRGAHTSIPSRESIQTISPPTQQPTPTPTLTPTPIPTPTFATPSQNRPSSVASSSSSRPPPLPISSTGKSAPAMAITTSTDGSTHSQSTSPGPVASLPMPELSRRVLRKGSTNSLSPVPIPFMEDMFKASPTRGSPLAEVPESAFGAGTGNGKGSLNGSGSGSAGNGFANLGMGMGSSKIVRGFSIRGRKGSNVGKEGEKEKDKEKDKSSAMDMLRRFDSSG